jgi:hypothetical protein
MRVKNVTADLYRRHFLAITARDFVVAACCLLREHESLPAFWHFARALPGAIRGRERIQSRRRASDAEMARWFGDEPVSYPWVKAEAARKPVARVVTGQVGPASA